MGMASAYGIVKNHGGWISVDSELEKGTSVQVFLPVVKLEPKPEVKSGIGSFKASRTILIIEDDDLFIRAVQAVLQRIVCRPSGRNI